MSRHAVFKARKIWDLIKHLGVGEVAARLAARSMPVSDKGCIEMTGYRYGGYGHIILAGRSLLGHRVAWALANGREIPLGQCVCHRCDNPACINPNHLWLGTSVQNTADMDAKGRRSTTRTPGEKHWNARLANDDVVEIFTSTEKISDLAERFGIGVDHVRQIKNGKSWSHVTKAKYKGNYERSIPSPRTHCAVGHPLVTGNIVRAGIGRIRCRTCNITYVKKWRAERGREYQDRNRLEITEADYIKLMEDQA